MRSYLSQLTGSVRGSGLRGQVVRGSVAGISLKSAQSLLGLLLAIMLARSLGATNYGVYAYVYALISVLALPAKFGLPQLLVRETARSHALENWKLMRGVWLWSWGTGIGLSITIGVVSGVVGWYVADKFSDAQMRTYYWGLTLIPLLALGALRDGALRGLRHVVRSQVSESIIRPGVLLALVAISAVNGLHLTAPTAMQLHAISAFCAFLAGAWLLRISAPAAILERPRPVFQGAVWRASVLPLALVTGMQLLNKQIDILMIGVFRTADDVGVYRIVVQGAVLVAFGLHAISLVVTPHFARLFALDDSVRLQRLATASARVMFFLALPVAGIFVVYGSHILSLVFGEEYARGYNALVILSVGQVGNAAFGAVLQLLNMTGNEKATVKTLAWVALLNIVLNLILIPFFGIIGAAAATSFTLLLWNWLLYRTLQTKTGLYSSVVGASLSPRE